MVLAARPTASQVPLSGPSHSSGARLLRPVVLRPPARQRRCRLGLTLPSLRSAAAILGKRRSAWEWARGGDGSGERSTAGREEALFVAAVRIEG